MAGIYIHIPFCKQACHYCNFHFSTTFDAYKEDLINALIKEIRLKKDLLKDPVDTIYFGGGTPSLLSKEEIDTLINVVFESFNVRDPEITLEGNPDDLSLDKLLEIKSSGVNRLSVGIQSFFEEDLKLMNRGHSQKQSFEVLQNIKEAGFTNYSIDFIFAQPLLSDEKWKENLKLAIKHKVPHISCYNLTVEEQTALSKFIKKGKLQAINEEKGAAQFVMGDAILSENGYDHYEISNYALPGFKSKHNTSYWYQKDYIGIGPSAHSYIKGERYSNVSNNIKFIKHIEEGKLFYEKETLSRKDLYNEFVMTRLRLKEGIRLAEIKEKFPEFNFESIANAFVLTGEIIFANGSYSLTAVGKLLADNIAGEFFEV